MYNVVAIVIDIALYLAYYVINKIYVRKEIVSIYSPGPSRMHIIYTSKKDKYSFHSFIVFHLPLTQFSVFYQLPLLYNRLREVL